MMHLTLIHIFEKLIKCQTNIPLISCVQKILFLFQENFHKNSEISSQQFFERSGAWQGNPLFLEERMSGTGAPHYHVLLWIDDAPVIGKHPPKDVVNWIEGKITCRIPDEKASPELHPLVTKYQLHKCSNYCKRKRSMGIHSLPDADLISLMKWQMGLH